MVKKVKKLPNMSQADSVTQPLSSSLFSLRSNRLSFMNHWWLLWGKHSKSLARFCSYTGKFISIFISMNIFLLGVKNNITKQVRVVQLRAGDDQKGKLCTAGRKIIALPQVKNIVALLKSACQPSYIIRMFKY